MTFTPNEARAHIDRSRLNEALKGDDEDITQFRNISSAVDNIINEFGAKRQKSRQDGLLTPEGLALGDKVLLEEAAAKITKLGADVHAPRSDRIKKEMGELWKVTYGKTNGVAADERLLTALLKMPKQKMMEEAIKSPYAAQRIINEDTLVTGVTEQFIEILKEKHANDPQIVQRRTLQGKLNAANAAGAALQNGINTIRKATEAA